MLLVSGQLLHVAGSVDCISVTWCIYINVCRPVTDRPAVVWPW